jgi:DNA-binding transcriptional regulator YhcF (GntR family)
MAHLPLHPRRVKRLERIPAAARLADLLRAELEGGRWPGRLPGTRLLASESGVSQPVAAEALRLLARQGLVVRSGDRKAYTNARDAPALAVGSRSKQPLRRAVILTHVELGNLPYSTRLVIEQTRSLLVKRGWELEIITFDFLHAKRPRRAWDHLVPMDPAIPLVAVFGRQAIGEWSLKRGLRMAFLGGLRGDLPLPMIAVKSSLLAEEAIRRLTELGHRRIIMPLCDRPPSFAASMKDAMEKGLRGAGVRYVPSYHTPESPYQQPEVVWRMMEACFRRSVPTALVILDWKEFVTISCLLAERGLRVPHDVSVVLLNESMEADWFVPKITCFRFPTLRLAKALAAWVEGKLADETQCVMGADFDDEGGSLAPPPPGSTPPPQQA